MVSSNPDLCQFENRVGALETGPVDADQSDLTEGLPPPDEVSEMVSEIKPEAAVDWAYLSR